MPPINIANAPTSTIGIQSLEFEVPAPFVEGHQLRANEAAVLNQTYAENLRNNFAPQVKQALTEDGPLDVAALQSKLNEYVLTYDFGVRRGSGRSTVRDPVTKEAFKLAREAVTTALRKKGITSKEAGAEKLAEMTKAVFERHSEILLNRAKEIVRLKMGVTEELTV